MDKAEIVAEQTFSELFERYLPDTIKELETTNVDDFQNNLDVFFRMYQSANIEEKESIKSYIETIIFDVASTIFGGFDEATDLGSLAGEFKITYDSENIEGDLQHNFIRNVQEWYEKND